MNESRILNTVQKAETLYDQESIHQINLALKECLTQYPIIINAHIDDFSNTLKTESVLDVYRSLMKTTQELEEYRYSYVLPEPMIWKKPTSDAPQVKTRLMTEDERIQNDRDGNWEIAVGSFKKVYGRELWQDYIDNDSRLVTHQQYRDLRIQVMDEPTTPEIVSRERPTEYSASFDTLLTSLAIDAIPIPVTHEKFTHIMAEGFDDDKCRITKDNIYFLDYQEERHYLPWVETMSESEVQQLRKWLTAHIKKSLHSQESLLARIEAKISEHAKIKAQQEKLWRRQEGDSSDKQSVFLSSLISANKRLSRPEKIALAHVAQTFSKHFTGEVITALDKENNPWKKKKNPWE